MFTAFVRVEWRMIKKLRLPLLCAALAGIVIAGFLFGLLGSKDAPASFSAFNDDTGQAAAGKADRLVAEILKRPLFTPGRQPPEVKIVKAEPPKLQGRLAGVMLRQDTRVALFTRPGGKPISVKEGETIDGWTTAKIEAGRVVLTSAFGEQIVKPTPGAADEITPGHRPVKKPTPTKPAQAGQPQPASGPKPQQLATGAGSTGKK
jgi:hypothetical protein